MDAALATLDLPTLQSYRADAIAALHKLNIGQRSEEIAYQGYRRRFSVGEAAQLRAWINDLQSAIDAKDAGVTSRRAPIHPGMGF
jgi:hypothetical protein